MSAHKMLADLHSALQRQFAAAVQGDLGAVAAADAEVRFALLSLANDSTLAAELSAEDLLEDAHVLSDAIDVLRERVERHALQLRAAHGRGLRTDPKILDRHG